ncbi:MAG: hypothetical protein HETSPECPRED_006429 [Heterodermia speciosa]|uniref:Uncharacterized protein n=1 Tax=Heterodermia speciosa TaxID=116794 RepID=A0A8H3IUA6_9LECA|nr:MAG: hypothetical protein HETSPECPRED_006429 [Heterodermia speciosa]
MSDDEKDEFATVDLVKKKHSVTIDEVNEFQRDHLKEPTGLGTRTRQPSADLLSARQPSSLSQPTGFAPPLRRPPLHRPTRPSPTPSHDSLLKRQRSAEILNSVKKQVVQSPMLKKAETFLTASTRFLDFVYSRVVTQKNKQECDAFSMAYDRLLDAMNKNKRNLF